MMYVLVYVCNVYGLYFYDGNYRQGHVNHQATKLFIATSATKRGDGYHPP